MNNFKKKIINKNLFNKKHTLNDHINNKDIQWFMPTYINGKNFNSIDNMGINIYGKLGQKIFAAADGKVVYAGNALDEYGKLIIIKHNQYYLSLYAHNDEILVKEQQEIKAKQKIATMGINKNKIALLYFDIRYMGKSIDLLKILKINKN